MKIAIGCDHAALELKREIIGMLRADGHEVRDFGTDSGASCDYPDIAKPVAMSVKAGECERGILICGTGLGMSYVANKVPGIRAACVSEPVSARLAREHNDAQIVCFGARVVGGELAIAITQTFINTAYSGDPRHQRRIDKIEE